MLDLTLLKKYIIVKLKLGIKGKEQQKHLKELIKQYNSEDKAYQHLADEIIDNNKDYLEEFFNIILESKENLTTNDLKTIDGIHQTLAKLVADFNTKQVQFILAEDAPINILSGSVRSGKTWVACFKFGLKVMNSPLDSRFLMGGHTLKSLEANCFKYFKAFFGQYFTYSLNQKSATLFGHNVRLEGFPNERSVEKITGDTLAGALLDEIQTIPQNCVLQVYARCSDGDGFIFGTCNPKHKKHWLYAEWITGKNMQGMVKTWNFLVSDNKFLPKKYIESLSILFQGIFYDRNVLGKWCAAEGIVFKQFANNHNSYIIKVVKKEDIQRLNKEIAFAVIGLDFGGNKSGSTITITGFYKDVNKGMIVLRSKKLIDEKGTIDSVRLNNFINNNINQFKNKYTIPLYNLQADCAEQYLIVDVRNNIRKQGWHIPVEDSLKLRIMDRVQFISKMLALQAIQIVEDDADTLIASLDELVYDDKASEDKILDDGSTDNDSWDSFSYTFTRLIGRFKYL